jgi:hypothetical protein
LEGSIGFLSTGQQLFGYLDDNITPPPQTILVADSVGTQTTMANPAFMSWLQQDQIILSTIISSLFKSPVTLVVGLPTSHVV